MCRSRVLLDRSVEAEYIWAIVQKQGIAGKCAEAGYFRISALKLGIAVQVCGSRVMICKCSEAGYCRAGVQKKGITGQVCRSTLLMAKCAGEGYR